MHIIVRHLPFLFFCHLALDIYYDHHIVADALIIIRISCCDGHLVAGFLFSGIDLQGIRLDDGVVLLSVYTDLEAKKRTRLTIDNITSISLTFSLI